MSKYYDKEDLKEKLELEQIYDLLELWGAEPEYSKDGIIAQTICHNLPGEGSRKLYYYENNNSGLFHCYTHCGESFDIFDLCIKVMDIQKSLKWELYDAMNYIASYFGFEGISAPQQEQLKDWEVFKRYNKAPIESQQPIKLKEYNPIILTRFSYPRIESWEQEGISDRVIKQNYIGYYQGGDQITIPHFDIEGKLIGIRGRTIGEEEAKHFGKYRPLIVNKQLYNHPLSMNLYHLNRSKDNIKQTKTAIVFESEKATLMYETIYGHNNDISVACCGSSLSNYQVKLLKDLGVRELILAFDRDFVEIGDDNFKKLKQKLIHLKQRYGSMMRVTCIFDKHMLLPLHSSPIDQDKQTFEKLLAERFVPQ